MGIKEHIIFPEIDYDKVDRMWGMDIVIGTTATSDDEARALLAKFNFPFREGVRREPQREALTSQATQDRVKAGLVAKYGDDLNFEFKVTPELLGGMRVRVGNDVWDGSVKSRLDRLANSF